MDMKPPGKRPRTMWTDAMDRDMKMVGLETNYKLIRDTPRITHIIFKLRNKYKKGKLDVPPRLTAPG